MVVAVRCWLARSEPQFLCMDSDNKSLLNKGELILSQKGKTRQVCCFRDVSIVLAVWTLDAASLDT